MVILGVELNTTRRSPAIGNVKTSNALIFYRVTSKGYLSASMIKAISQFLNPNDSLSMKLEIVHVCTPKGCLIFVNSSLILSY